MNNLYNMRIDLNQFRGRISFNTDENETVREFFFSSVGIFFFLLKLTGLTLENKEIKRYRE